MVGFILRRKLTGASAYYLALPVTVVILARPSKLHAMGGVEMLSRRHFELSEFSQRCRNYKQLGYEYFVTVRIVGRVLCPGHAQGPDPI